MVRSTPQAKRFAQELCNVLRNEGFRVYTLSERDGFVILLVESSDKRIALWIRSSPVSKAALDLAKKIISKYNVDKSLLVKLFDKPDYVKVDIESIVATKPDEVVYYVHKYINSKGLGHGNKPAS